MQTTHQLQFKCQQCEKMVDFSVFKLDKKHGAVCCPHCQLLYDFSDETLTRQLRQFEKLCLQIQQSEEILSNSSIGIYLGDREIKIPYKILLTRLNSTLELVMGKKPLTILFRIEPALDLKELNQN